MNVQRWLRLVALPSVLASLVVMGTSLVAAAEVAVPSTNSRGLIRGLGASDLGQAEMPGRTSVSGTVTGINSTSEPPIVFLQTAEGEVRVSILDRRLLALTQIGGALTLTGQASRASTVRGDRVRPDAGNGPGSNRRIGHQANADLTGVLVGVDTFATPPVGQVRTDDGTVWFITIGDAQLLRSMPMGQPVNLLGRKVGGILFEVTDVLP